MVVTGTMEFYDFPFSWECHVPNWLIFFGGVGIPPTSHNIFHEKSMLMSNPNAKIWPVYFSMFPTSRMPRSWNTPTMWSTSRSASHQRFRRCLDCHRLRTGVGWIALSGIWERLGRWKTWRISGKVMRRVTVWHGAPIFVYQMCSVTFAVMGCEF